MNVRIVGDEGDEILAALQPESESMTETTPIGTYLENTTGLLVCVVLVQRFQILEYRFGPPAKVATEYEYRTEGGQHCFDDTHADPASGPPNILRCHTMRQTEPLYLIRQR